MVVGRINTGKYLPPGVTVQVLIQRAESIHRLWYLFNTTSRPRRNWLYWGCYLCMGTCHRRVPMRDLCLARVWSFHASTYSARRDRTSRRPKIRRREELSRVHVSEYRAETTSHQDDMLIRHHVHPAVQLGRQRDRFCLASS